MTRRTTSPNSLILRDLKFAACVGSLCAIIPDPVDLREHVKRCKSVLSADFYWRLNVRMRERKVQMKGDGEIIEAFLEPTIYHDHLVLPNTARWPDLVGRTIRWNCPADINTGIPNGGFYVWEHGSIPVARLNFVERKG